MLNVISALVCGLSAAMGGHGWDERDWGACAVQWRALRGRARDHFGARPTRRRARRLRSAACAGPPWVSSWPASPAPGQRKTASRPASMKIS